MIEGFKDPYQLEFYARKGDLIMLNNKEKNPSIQCVVEECKYHANNADYCTLDSIRVTSTTKNSQTSEDTECGSFIAKGDKFF